MCRFLTISGQSRAIIQVPVFNYSPYYYVSGEEDSAPPGHIRAHIQGCHPILCRPSLLESFLTTSFKYMRYSPKIIRRSFHLGSSIIRQSGYPPGHLTTLKKKYIAATAAAYRVTHRLYRCMVFTAIKGVASSPAHLPT